MIVVIGTFRIPLEHRDEALAAMQRVIVASRAEQCCIAYSYAEDVLEPGLFRVSEVWENRESLTTHFETVHMQVWKQERAGFGMSGRQVTAYVVGEEEAL